MSHAPADAFPWRQASRQHASEHAVALRGARLHYRAWSQGKGPLLLLVHGFAGHTHWWDWIAPSFCDQYDVVAMDLSGMGDSDWRSAYPPETYPLDILELIEHLDCGPAQVVGHSFGGGCLLRACALESRSGTAPRIAGAVVVDAYVRIPGHRIPSGRPTSGTRRAYADLETALGRFRLNPPQEVADPAMMDYLARTSLRFGTNGWGWKFDPTIPGPTEQDASKMLASIEIPVDIIYGEQSSIVDRSLAEACVRLLPDGRGPVEIRGGAHHLMLDRPQALVEALMTALGDRR